MNSSVSTTAIPGLGADVPALDARQAAPRMFDGSQLLTSGLKWLLLALLLVGMGCPLLFILGQAVLTPDGTWAGSAPFVRLFSNINFLPMLGRSLWVSFVTAAVTVPLAYAFAYALQRTCVPLKGMWRGIGLLPLLAPSLLPGIALIYLFGNQGLFKELMNGGIYGFWGILLGEVFYTFPHALMILLSALSQADGRLYDAASAMGASRWRTFSSVTLPATRYGIFGAFCLVFTLTITDFGVPKIAGGAYSVLAVEAYKAVVGQQQFGRGALIGLLLLVPAVLTFAVDAWLQRRQRAQMSSRSEAYVPRPDWKRDGFNLLAVALISAAILIMIAVAMGASLVKLWPYNLALTLQHYDFDNMDGGGWLAYWNSLKLACGTSVAGTIVIFTGAWLMEKTRGPARLGAVLSPLLRFLCFLPMAVPGLVLGLGSLLFFNHPANPFNFLYGTMALLVVCSVVHFYTTAHLTAVTALKQLDPEFEAASLSLKVPVLKTFLRVTVPLCLPSLLEIFRYLFVSSMTTVSAVIFLYRPDTVLASVAVLNMDDAGDVGPAAAMSTLILLTSAAASLLMHFAGSGLVARTQAWRRGRGH
ncbi:putative 2-aminoethylphosphonate ABC transporter permease subunit [Herbaspirillum robiniae]|uniref:2-aminoethylphosphonate ABC transporter permease subunit n=1 Tax=Herbaspirillum robiniae TaxID=2014887 RepID=A0ABX2LPE9_9BURK|nr:putative 2-aminoethylphosphonate ABC transporter permease subunit [Herbaspirillum robiniae]NUT99975.1 putative 2-aminoethylphosphonate ABC transporter permease subunit [Herbaspirillum robiniae]